MKKKIITVCWSYTVAKELPDHVGIDELEAIDSPLEVQTLADEIVKEASENITWKDGIITDVQDFI